MPDGPPCGKYAVATKRVLRSFLKAANRCAQEPERVARFLADRATSGITSTRRKR